VKATGFILLWMLVGAVFLTGVFPTGCQAQAADSTYSLWDLPHRLYISAGANYDFYQSTVSEAPLEFRQEWSAGLYLAYSLTPHVSLAGASVYGIDTKLLRSSIGLRFNLYRPAKRPPTGG
jgi:hypothetical protein